MAGSSIDFGARRKQAAGVRLITFVHISDLHIEVPDRWSGDGRWTHPRPDWDKWGIYDGC
jgi:hypothetical protein